MELKDAVTTIRGIGQKSAERFGKLGIETVYDLLVHYPRDYDLFDEVVPVSNVREGAVEAVEVTFPARLVTKIVRNLKIVSGMGRDGSGNLLFTWFNMPYLANSLKVGTHYILRGRILRKNGVLCMQQPVIYDRNSYETQKGHLKPVYPLTAGITSNAIGKAVGQVLSEISADMDYLPAQIKRRYGICGLKKAFGGIHFPKNFEELIEARKRLVFDEFFLFSLAMQRMKGEKEREENHYPVRDGEVSELMERLPFSLTGAQKKVISEIITDMQGEKQMNRLIQGDVGSGKTVVAAFALYLAVKNGYQGAIMVPTEILANQHKESLEELLAPLGIRVGLLTGGMKAAEKKKVCQALSTQEIDIVVGTHALIQEKVSYQRLGLVITDEQHRFGVRQRESFFQKGGKPHILVMSATPIPRTLAIIFYGDLDISVMDELPKDRLPIKNCVVDTSWRPNAFHFLEKQVAQGRQAYVICPMVEESENMEAENVLDYTEQLRGCLPYSVKTEYLHGKMKAKEKEAVMERFARNETQILVSTTVVEVGVNVPNATVMMIENAERFGLAQLHQLRGRVGRGKHQSYCIFMSGSSSRQAKERLEVLNRSNDGFEIAREDLKLRGPGDFFGIRQSGELQFALADIYQDADILSMANEAAKEVQEDTKRQMKKSYQPLLKKLEEYGTEISL